MQTLFQPRNKPEQKTKPPEFSPLDTITLRRETFTERPMNRRETFTERPITRTRSPRRRAFAGVRAKP
jgi:hypothetical protein